MNCRYQLDERVGCIAIVDTQHQDFSKRENGFRNGLGSDDTDVIYYATGKWENGSWNVPKELKEEALRKLEYLNASSLSN